MTKTQLIAKQAVADIGHKRLRELLHNVDELLRDYVTGSLYRLQWKLLRELGDYDINQPLPWVKLENHPDLSHKAILAINKAAEHWTPLPEFMFPTLVYGIPDGSEPHCSGLNYELVRLTHKLNERREWFVNR